MAFLNREAILSANDAPTADVAVPEWGGTVRVRTMSARERDAFEWASIAADKEGVTLSNVRARFAVACCIDEAGKPVFTDEDIAMLGDKSGAALDRIYQAIAKLNALGAGDIEEAAKN